MNLLEMVKSFQQIAQTRYGQGFDPSTMVKNMLGQNINSPQDALNMLIQTGRINQQQYNMFAKML